MTDPEVEKIIPIIVTETESCEDCEGGRSQDDLLHKDCDFNQCKSSAQGEYDCVNPNDGPPFPGSYGWYPQLPPTINIFACPPPPPPYNPTGRQSHFISQTPQGRVVMEHTSPNGSSIGVESNQPFENSTGCSSSAGTTTPPPPELTTPFNCDESKAGSHTLTAQSEEYDFSGSSSFGKMNNPSYNLHLLQRGKIQRFNPYQPELRLSQIKQEPELEVPKKHLLCIDTQDFDPSEISIKLKDKTLTIEGAKSTNSHSGKFCSMKHEYTFSDRKEAENTSCTFHPGGKLILHLNYDSGNKDNRSQTSAKHLNS